MDDYESPPTVDEILLSCTKKPFMSSLDCNVGFCLFISERLTHHTLRKII